MKSSFMSSLMRNIAKQKAENDENKAFYYEERLHYISKTLANHLKAREKVRNTDYDRQVTSETFANHVNKNGKQSPFMFWAGERDNHYLDCNCYIQVAIIQDNLASLKKPDKKEDIQETLSTIRGIFKS